MRALLCCALWILAGCAPAALPAPVSVPSPVPSPVATVAPTVAPLPTALPTAESLAVPLDLPRKLAADGTPLYAEPAATAPVLCLVEEPMHIVAVVEVAGDFSRVRAVQCDGWALSANLRPPF